MPKFFKILPGLFLAAMLFSLVAGPEALRSGRSAGLMDSLLNSEPGIAGIISNPKKYRIQIIYTQIDRDTDNKPSFKQYDYFLDSNNYFYCASLVKLPCSILALEKINELKIQGLTKDSKMITDSASSCQKRVLKDTSSANGFPSVAHYIRRMLLVSDNQAYGRIYEFLTPDYIHKRLWQLGFTSMRIIHRFDGGCKGADNLTTNPISFYNDDKLLYRQELQLSKQKYVHPLSNTKVGKAYINSGGKKVNEPKDFNAMNNMSLQDIHDVLKNLVFNEYLPSSKKFRLTAEDRNFLMKYLGMYPRESDHPRYDPKVYYDSYKKYFMFGDSRKPITNTDVRIFNIVGQSYGFMVDCAYIVDQKKKTEFMLAAVIYANETEVINSGRYEYNSVALPYLSRLGQVFYNYELKRKRKVVPDLNEFNYDYEKH
ncbi:MAG: serine hydrolase [Bacteroidia bacterium]